MSEKEAEKKAAQMQNSARQLAGGFVRFGARVGDATLVPKDAKVEGYRHPALKEGTLPTYSEIKSAFKADVVAKAARFHLSEHVANQLSVEVEEQKRFEKKVQEEVDNRLTIVKREAHDKGLQDGFEKGRTTAYEEEKARLAALMELLASGIASVGKAKESLAEQYEKTLVDMAFRLAEILLHTEIQQRPDAVFATVSQILQRIARDEDVRIRLSARDIEAIDQVKTQVESLGRVGRVAFDADSTIEPGDCIVESSSGEIASFMEEKLAKLHEAMLTSVSMERQKETGTG